MTVTNLAKKQILNLESNIVEERGAAIKVLSIKHDVEIIHLLMTKLKENTSTQFREGACRILAELKAKEALDVLIECLNDPDDGVKFYAASALKNISDPRTVKPILRILNQENSDSEFRSELISTLGNIGDLIAIDPLIGILRNDKDKFVRHYAARALGSMKNIKAIGVLKEVAKNEGNTRLHFLALDAIEQIKQG